MKLSLRMKAILGVSLVFILCISVVTTISYLQAKEQIITSLRQGAQQTVTIHAQNLSTWVQTRLAEVQVIANTDLVKTMDTEKVLPYLNREKKRFNGIYNSISIGDTTGKLTLDDGIFIDISSESTFPLVIKGQSTISDPFPAKQNPADLIISMEVPIVDNNGKVTGLISGASLVSTVFKSTADFHIGKTDQVFIAHKDGTVLYHPNQEWILKHNLFKDEQPVYANAIQKAITDNVQFQEINVSGKDMILFSSPIANTSWYMFLEIPTAEYTESLNSLILFTVFAVLIAIVILLILVTVFTKYLFKKIEQISQAAEQTAAGDLCQQLPEGTDELGKLNSSFNYMVKNLQEIVREVHSTSTSVTSNAEKYEMISEKSVHIGQQVGRTIEDLALGSQQMSENVGHIASSVMNMESKVHQLVDISDCIKESLVETKDKTSLGSTDVKEASQKFDEVKQSVESSNRAMTELEKHSASIANMTTTITSIASQTNLLALNASIEAARAGENGRGFAVVANEVKKLAEMSAQAAAEVSSEVHEILSQTQQAAEAMQKSSDGMTAGTQAISSILRTFADISSHIEKVNEVSLQVAAIAKELSIDNHNISEATSKTSAIGEEFAAAAASTSQSVSEQAASLSELEEASQTLTVLAEHLSKSIGKFKLS